MFWPLDFVQVATVSLRIYRSVPKVTDALVNVSFGYKLLFSHLDDDISEKRLTNVNASSLTRLMVQCSPHPGKTGIAHTRTCRGYCPFILFTHHNNSSMPEEIYRFVTSWLIC